MTNATAIVLGTVFVASWGYDQTNVDFYKVTKVTPKGVRLRKIGKRQVADHETSVSVVPDLDAPADAIELSRRLSGDTVRIMTTPPPRSGTGPRNVKPRRVTATEPD